MKVTELFTQINAAYRGTDDDAPSAGSTDYDLWLATANRKQDEWAKNPKINWRSLFETRDMGTISATQDYDLDDDFIGPSDKIIVRLSSGQKIEYQIADPSERDRFYRSVYIAGRDPKVLTFYDTITSSSQIFGGTLEVPGYFAPDPLTKATSTIAVDDPYWLVYAVASELAFNDLTYESKYPDLNAKANNLWANMVSANRRGTNNNPRRARTNVTRIPGSNR